VTFLSVAVGSKQWKARSVPLFEPRPIRNEELKTLRHLKPRVVTRQEDGASGKVVRRRFSSGGKFPEAPLAGNLNRKALRNASWNQNREEGVYFGMNWRVGLAHICRLFLGVLALAIPSPGEDGTTFGPTVNGLRMSVALMNTPEPSLRVTLENAGDVPILVRVGNGSSDKPDHLTLRGYLTDEHNETREVVFGSGGAFIVIGNIKSIVPFTIPLRPKAHYEIDTRLSEWSVVEDISRSRPLSGQILAAYAIRIELDGSDCFTPHDKRLLANWPDPGFSADMRLAGDWKCWQGRSTSNKLHTK
jgi:hypothetical protein